jgi:hypothetical protein
MEHASDMNTSALPRSSVTTHEPKPRLPGLVPLLKFRRHLSHATEFLARFGFPNNEASVGTCHAICSGVD